MKPNEFLDIYQQLSSTDVDMIDSRLGDIAMLGERHDDLKEKIDALLPAERESLYAEQKSFLQDAQKEMAELAGSAHAAADADEEEMHRQSNILDAENHTYEHVTNYFPIGVEWLNRDIEAAREEIASVVQAAAQRRGV